MDQNALPAAELRLAARLRCHVAELLRLAAPVIVARAGLLVMAIVDTIIVGRYGTTDLAHLSLANAPVGMMIGIGVGLLLGTLVITANALGREQPQECGVVLWRSVVYGAGIGFVGLGICLMGEPLLLLTGQDPALAAGAGRIMAILGIGLPAAMIYTTAAFFLEGLKRPLPGMLAMIAANLLNALLGWLLVFGHWGLPELGGPGVAWASTIVRIFLAVVMLGYIWQLADRRRFAIRHWPGWRWQSWRQQRRIGYGGGLSIGIEAGAFTWLSFFAGWLGALPLAAYSVALNLLALIFMVALGLGSATAVRVGVAHGRRDMHDVVLAGWTGLGVNSLVMVALGIVLWAMPGTIAQVFSNDAALIAVVTPMVAFAAFILVVDGGQVVLANALRGRGDAFGPTALHAVSYLVVMVPLGWALAFPLGRGVMGLFEGILIASIVSMTLLAFRFQWLAGRDAQHRRQTALDAVANQP